MRGKVLVDGPVAVEIAGNLVTVRGASDGQPITLVLRLEDALISAHRFAVAHESALRERAECRIIPLPARHADTA